MSTPASPIHASRHAFARLAAATSALSLLLVAVGGAVRATDSGLACPTWPGCFSAGDFLPPSGFHVWIEHTHRLLAGVVGVLVAVLLVWALARFRSERAVLWPAVAAAVLINVQAALGALVVLHLLRAELVTAHLGMGMAVVALLLTLAHNASVQRDAAAPHRGDAVDRRFARLTVSVAALTYVQILVGGHVTGIAAGLAYRDGPLLGIVSFTPVHTQADVFNVAHRVLAVVLALAVAVLVWQVRATRASGWLRRLPAVAAGLVGLQIVLGVGNLASGLSFVTVIPHLAVASWIWAVLVLATLLAYAPAPTPAARPQPSRPQVALR